MDENSLENMSTEELETLLKRHISPHRFVSKDIFGDIDIVLLHHERGLYGVIGTGASYEEALKDAIFSKTRKVSF